MKRDDELERHLAHWRQSGLVSDELAARLRASSAELHESSSIPWVRWALAVLGGGLVLAGLILVVAENWSAIHRYGKLAGWLAIYLILLAGVRWLGRTVERPWIAEALAFVAGSWVFAGIVLISQIYQLNSRPANGFWFWLALVLPLCWVLPWRALTLVVFVAATSAFIAEVATKGSWASVTSAAGPWLWLLVPCLTAWVVSWLPRPVPWLPAVVGVWFIVVSQFFLLMLGAIQELDHSDLGAAWWVAGAGLAVTLVLPSRVLPEAWGSLTSRLLVVLSLSPWVVLGRWYDPTNTHAWIAVGLSWLVQFVAALLLIRRGAVRGQALWVNLGFLGLLAGIVVRYFDLFGQYLRGGAALALTGLLILVVLAGLERQRRRTLAQSGGPS